VITSYVWNLHLQDEETREIARNVARVYIQSDNSYRRWNALQGGIYIPSDKAHLRNLPADVPDQVVITPSGKRLILTDHASMMDEVYEFSKHDYISKVELKSLDPISEDGRANAWEAKALKAIARGEKEFGEVITINGEKHFSLMNPFIIEEPCLKCHGNDGYEVGDLRGGINVFIPLSKFGIASTRQLEILKWGHFLWWLLGILGIGISYLRHQLSWTEEQSS
jgi:hypothetical protein